MRHKLKEMREFRGTFIGIFEKFGIKNGYNGRIETTILLKDIVTLDGEEITDHLWFNYTKGFQELGELHKGDKIQFNARGKEYEKGYKGWREDVYNKPIQKDYKLVYPTQIKLYLENKTESEN